MKAHVSVGMKVAASGGGIGGRMRESEREEENVAVGAVVRAAENEIVVVVN